MQSGNYNNFTDISITIEGRNDHLVKPLNKLVKDIANVTSYKLKGWEYQEKTEIEGVKGVFESVKFLVMLQSRPYMNKKAIREFFTLNTTTWKKKDALIA